MSEDYGYVFVVAGDDTLKAIDQIKQKAWEALVRCKEIANLYGADMQVSEYGFPNFSFKGEVPKDWKRYFSRAGLRTEPDYDTVGGKALGAEISKLREALNVQQRFSELCRNLVPEGEHLSYTYSFQELNGTTVVKCPMTSATNKPRRFYIPQDCTQISFVEYIKLKESAKTPEPREVITFSRKLAP